MVLVIVLKMLGGSEQALKAAFELFLGCIFCAYFIDYFSESIFYSTMTIAIPENKIKQHKFHVHKLELWSLVRIPVLHVLKSGCHKGNDTQKTLAVCGSQDCVGSCVISHCRELIPRQFFILANHINEIKYLFKIPY